jgi:hypothetical protein
MWIIVKKLKKEGTCIESNRLFRPQLALFRFKTNLNPQGEQTMKRYAMFAMTALVVLGVLLSACAPAATPLCRKLSPRKSRKKLSSLKK